jgi:hypothetical protein
MTSSGTMGGRMFMRVLMLGTSGTVLDWRGTEVPVLDCSCGCRGQAPDCPGKGAPAEEPREPAREPESDG